MLNVGLLENTAMGQFFLTVLLVVAQMKKNSILEQTQVGKEIAKTKTGFREGRPPKFTAYQLEEAVKMKEHLGYSYKEIEKHTKISKSTLIRAVKDYRDKLATQEIAKHEPSKISSLSLFNIFLHFPFHY